MSHYNISKGEHLTLKGTAVDDNGNAVTLTSGYSFYATVKKLHSTADGSALSDIDSTADSSRFSTASNTVTTTILTSAETNGATPGHYYYSIWAKNTSTSQEYLVSSGTIFISDSPTDTKS